MLNPEKQCRARSAGFGTLSNSPTHKNTNLLPCLNTNPLQCLTQKNSVEPDQLASENIEQLTSSQKHSPFTMLNPENSVEPDQLASEHWATLQLTNTLTLYHV